MKKKNEKFNYESALEELTHIQEQLENNEVPIDQLATQVKRANELLQQCQQKLRDTEAEITQMTNLKEEE